MKIQSIASSSAGNSYAIEENGEVLLIDCGIPVKRIREAIGGFENVVGCFVSHQHGDHCGYVSQLSKVTSFPIIQNLAKDEYYFLNNFKIRPVPLFHDSECFGFYILTKTDSLFYATDTSAVPYTFPGLKKLMIEANFDWKLMAESSLQDFVIRRTIENHLDIDSAIEFIKRHQDLEEIHLLHLSDSHSNAEDFKRRVVEVAGVPTFVASK